ncbi:MAG: class I SAM-dependent methyltransferase, partial [Myxococcales bacterium]|nr:class I SAM-dependent methyltransferase [Myxococcales bacterium]
MRSPSDEQARTYRDRARDYHRLVMAEDCEGNLRGALEGNLLLAGARVVEVGAGTGRLTRLMLDGGAEVYAFEREASMLRLAREYAPGARFALADARRLPVG